MPLPGPLRPVRCWGVPGRRGHSGRLPACPPDSPIPGTARTRLAGQNRLGVATRRRQPGSRYPFFSSPGLTNSPAAVRSASALATVPGPWPFPACRSARTTSLRVSGRSAAPDYLDDVPLAPGPRPAGPPAPSSAATGIARLASQTWTRQANRPSASASGIRGVVLPDMPGGPVAYMLVTRASNYYRNMTEQEPLMPVLVIKSFDRHGRCTG